MKSTISIVYVTRDAERASSMEQGENYAIVTNEKGETIFATLAKDSAFTTAQAECGNALSRLKQAQQALMEHWLKSHDLPTRSELNSVHLRLRDMSRRIVELEQQLATPIKKPAKRASRKQVNKP